MGYTIFKNNEQPALSDTTLNNMQKGLLELVFPIGSTYVTQTSETGPAQILGFGTWERLKGKVCLGVDENDQDFNTIGKTGGEKTHTLSIEEMPSHEHELVSLVAGHGSESNWVLATSTATNGGYDYTKKVGGGKAHNIMQPYEVVGYMWIRRA